MYDHVESFGKINRHGHSTVGGIELVEAPCDVVGKGEEGRGVARGEAAWPRPPPKL